MADLLTHYTTARLAGRLTGDNGVRSALVVGVLLPDLVGKPLEFSLLVSSRR